MAIALCSTNDEESSLVLPRPTSTAADVGLGTRLEGEPSWQPLVSAPDPTDADADGLHHHDSHAIRAGFRVVGAPRLGISRHLKKFGICTDKRTKSRYVFRAYF